MREQKRVYCGEHQYGMLLGIVVGMAVGMAMGTWGVGVAVGVALGVAFQDGFTISGPCSPRQPGRPDEREEA